MHYFKRFPDFKKWAFSVLENMVLSWQLLELAAAVPVVFVKIVGTHNSANEVFHCVHFECPADPLAPPPDDRSVLPKEVVLGVKIRSYE
ncbi:hypothetical protein ANCCAN_21383 [Ancylostoma caninum]|uniref:Uncharacterized protein n=1 Tax=Ancylostoma caninum TaxID=29170 RepID=A0A368FP47_ANCCA|nr:hypothetical protein ANCCAN_21383 [Ancylostoma caninum]